MNQWRTWSVNYLCAFVLFGAGCDKNKPVKETLSASEPSSQVRLGSGPSPSVASTEVRPAATSSAPTATPAVEMDLSSAGAKFKGWFAKGPEGASVVEDLGGARIVTKKVSGPGSFDLGISLSKRDLKTWKKNLTQGAEASKEKLTFTKDTATELEWHYDFGPSSSYSFISIVKVKGKDVTCYTVTPRDSLEAIAVLKEACATIRQK